MRFLPLLLLALPFSLQAKTYCCEVNGRTYCDEGLPAACYGKAHRELNAQGQTVRQIEAPLTPEQQARRDAEQARQREEEERLKEEERRNRKLIGMYPTLKDLDETHARMTDDMQKGLEQAKKRLSDLQTSRKKLDEEAEFYKKKAMPPALLKQMKASDRDIAAQETIIKERQDDIAQSKVKFAEERTRYITLTAKPAAR